MNAQIAQDRAAAARAEIVQNITQCREKIDAALHATCFGNYVLSWGNGLFVGITRDPLDGSVQSFATGFANATIFGDRQAAVAWLRRYQITNGKGESPFPERAFNAGQDSLVRCDDTIAMIKGL